MRRRTLRRRGTADPAPCIRPRRERAECRPVLRPCTTAAAAISAGTVSAAGDALQRLPARDALPWIWVEPMSSADSTTPGHIDFAAVCSPSSAPVTAAPMTSTPPSWRISVVSLIRLMSTTRSGRYHAGSELHQQVRSAGQHAPSRSLRRQGASLLLRRIQVPRIARTASLGYRLKRGTVSARCHRCPERPGDASASVSYSEVVPEDTRMRSNLGTIPRSAATGCDRERGCAPDLHVDCGVPPGASLQGIPYRSPLRIFTQVITLRKPGSTARISAFKTPSEAAHMYFDAPMRDGVRLSEAGAEAARAKRIRIRRHLVVRDRPRSVLPPSPGRACHRTARDRDEHRGCIRPHPVLDGNQRLGPAVGERRPAAAGTGNPGTAARRAPVLRRVRASGCTHRRLHRLPAGHLEHLPDRRPSPVRRAVLPLHADQRLLQPGAHRPSGHSGLPRRGEPADGRGGRRSGRRVQRAPHALAGLSPRGHPPRPRRGCAQARQIGRFARPGHELLRRAGRDRVRAQPLGTCGPEGRSRSTRRRRATGPFSSSTASSTPRSD